MDAYHTDDELEKLKTWWKNYGSSVIVGILLGAALVAGISYWRHYTTERSAKASIQYDALLAASAQNNVAAVRTAGTLLMDDYSATPYAGQAALILAKISYDAADSAAARTYLQWALDKATETSVRHMARLRLARILIEQDSLDAAQALAQVSDMGGFESEYYELRGDILVAKNEPREARSAYALALEKLAPGSSYARVLKVKLDNLGPETK